MSVLDEVFPTCDICDLSTEEGCVCDRMAEPVGIVASEAAGAAHLDVGSCHIPVSDGFALELGEGDEHGSEESPGGGRCVDGFIALHGTTATKGAGASVLRQLDGDIVSKAVGHTHRLAAVQRTVHVDNERRLLHGVETGTMANLEGLGYAVRPDWQGGWATADIWPDGRISIDLARWDDPVLAWRDRRWEITKTGVRRSS